MVVPHDDERWVRWTAAGLARLSRVWGCNGSVVVPSSAVGHPAVDRCLARLHPDHVVAYGPSWTTFDALYPGTIDRLLAEKNISDNSIAAQFKEMLRKEPWNGTVVHEAEAAADSLRSRLGANRRDDHVQCSHLFDYDNARELTPLAAVATTPVMGVPATLVTTPEALAYAMHVGIEASDASGDIPAEQWREQLSAAPSRHCCRNCTQMKPIEPTRPGHTRQRCASRSREPSSTGSALPSWETGPKTSHWPRPSGRSDARCDLDPLDRSRPQRHVVVSRQRIGAAAGDERVVELGGDAAAHQHAVGQAACRVR